MRVLLVDREGDHVHLVDGCRAVVDRHIEAGAEQMLVVWSGQAWCQFAGELRGALIVGGGEDQARRLRLELDLSVEVQIPVEAVVVVADRDEERDHESLLPAHIGRPGELLGVLPEHAGVFLVDANGIRQDFDVATSIRDRHVEVGDVADAVASQLQRVHQSAEQIFAGVEIVLPEAHRPRVSIWHEHLGDRRTMDDRPDASCVFEADTVQDQALAHVVADAQRPLLPGDHVAVEGEARALRLLDDDRLLRGALRTERSWNVVVGSLLGDGHSAGVDHIRDDAASDIDECDEAVDRVRPGHRRRRRLVVAEYTSHPSALFALDRETPGREAGERDCARIVDTAGGQRGAPALVVVEQFADECMLLLQKRHLSVRLWIDVDVGGECAGAQVDCDGTGSSALDIEQLHASTSGHRPPGGDILPVRLVEAEVGDPERIAQRAVFPQNLRHPFQLCLRERPERRAGLVAECARSLDMGGGGAGAGHRFSV